ncbi:MAG: acylphosphatase [Verrucomicrobiaceae bacterium]|nr:acylphosphatase [Verrucomicrobiaceae bacterium]
MEKYRLQVWFEGRVQGVGFRFKTSRIATGYIVSGFVENLDDGRVHLVAVGEIDEVRAFVDEVNEVMDCFIKSSEEKADFTSDLYKGFNIKL